MTGKEAGHVDQHPPHVNPDALEVAPGTQHENLEGWIPSETSDQALSQALKTPSHYRDNTTTTQKDATKTEGSLSDRRTATQLKDSVLPLYQKNFDDMFF